MHTVRTSTPAYCSLEHLRLPAVLSSATLRTRGSCDLCAIASMLHSVYLGKLQQLFRWEVKFKPCACSNLCLAAQTTGGQNCSLGYKSLKSQSKQPMDFMPKERLPLASGAERILWGLKRERVGYIMSGTSGRVPSTPAFGGGPRKAVCARCWLN